MNRDKLDLLNRRDFVDPGLPRRLSARQGDPHYEPAAARLSDRIEVLLDGKALDCVTSWDVDLGRIERHALNDEGLLILDSRRAPTFETLYGHVEVRWIREAKP